MGENSASLSFLRLTHVTFWSARGMKVARKWRISARTVFSRVTAVTGGTGDGTGLAGKGLAGRLDCCLWDGISGAWVSDGRLRRFTCSAHCATHVMTCCYWSEHQHEHFGFWGADDTWSFQMKSHTLPFFLWSTYATDDCLILCLARDSCCSAPWSTKSFKWDELLFKSLIQLLSHLIVRYFIIWKVLCINKRVLKK